MKKKFIPIIIGLLMMVSLVFALPAPPPTPSTQTPSITLAWNASASIPSAGYFDYGIWYGTNPTNYTQSIDAGTNLTVTITNLLRGTTYYFAAVCTDTNATLTSAYSASVNYTTLTIPIAPSSIHSSTTSY